MAAKNFSLSYVYSNGTKVTLDPNRCAATKRTSGSYYSYQCDRPAKVEFTQDDFNSLHPNNTGDSTTALAVRYVDTEMMFKLRASIGRKFCGQHSPLAIVAKQVKALEIEREESKRFVEKRTGVESRIAGLTQRIHDLGIESSYPVREHRDRWNNELSPTTAEVEFSLLEKLLNHINDLQSELRNR